MIKLMKGWMILQIRKKVEKLLRFVETNRFEINVLILLLANRKKDLSVV